MRAFALAMLVAWLGLAVATASPILVTLDTSALTGTNAQLAFDFIEGGPPANAVSVTAFSTDGTLGAATLTGDASGSLSGTMSLGDNGFFNEYLQDIVLGHWISFIFDTTGNAPDASSLLPDAFSLFLIDPATNQSLVHTSDPTGANALLLYSIGVPNALEVYAADEVGITAINAAPEPSSAMLIAGALLALAAFSRRRARA